MAVIKADNHHAEVKEIGDDREQRHLLPTMLRGSRRERAADLSVQGAPHPKCARLVEEVGHLRWYPAKARRSTDNDRVVGGEVIDLCDRRCLFELEVRLACDLF